VNYYFLDFPDSLYDISPKTPVLPEMSTNFWRLAETPGPISALDNHIEIIDSSEKISSDEENIDGEQYLNALVEEDEINKLYKSFFHQIKRFQPLVNQPQYFRPQQKTIVRKIVITETIFETGNLKKTTS
jgi:hypothetical protein